MCMMTPKLGSSFLAILAASWKNLQRSWGGHQSLRDRFVFGLTVSPGTMQAAMFRLSASWRSGKVQAVDAGKMWWLNHVSNVIVFRFPWFFFWPQFTIFRWSQRGPPEKEKKPEVLWLFQTSIGLKFTMESNSSAPACRGGFWLSDWGMRVFSILKRGISGLKIQGNFPPVN